MRDVGTIRGREARDVIEDVLEKRRVPKGVWAYRNKAFHFLVGSRHVALAAPAGMSFYGLQALVKRVESVCDEIEAAKRNKNQIDIEDAIREAT